MADETARTILQYTVDRQTLTQTEAATRRLKGEIASVGDTVRSKFNAPSAELSRRLKENTRDVQQYTGALDKLEGQLRATANEQKKLGGGATLSNIGRAAGPLAQVAGGIGGGPAGEGLRLIGDFAGALENAGPLAAAGAVALGGLSLALAEQARQTELTRQAIQAEFDALKTSIALRRELADLAESGDVEGAQKKLDTLVKDQLDSNEALTNLYDERRIIQEQLDAQGEDKSQQTLDQLAKNQELIDGEYKLFAQRAEEITSLQALVPLLRATVAVQEAVGKGTEKLKGDIKGFFEGLKTDVTDAGETLKKFGEGISEALKKELAAQEAQKRELASIQQSFNDDLAKLETDALEKRADLAKSYNDKLVDLAQAAADSAAKALQNLLAQREALATQLARDEATAEQQAQQDTLNAAIAFQREEERATRDHARNLRSIRDRAADSELKQIADRDFQSLFFSRRQTARELTDAGQTFLEERQERAIAANQAAQDRAAQFAFEREQRLAQYQQNLADADKAYRIEQAAITNNLAKQRQAANVAYQQSLTELNIAISAQLRLRRDGYVAELQLAAKTAEERLKIEQQVQNALLRQAQNTLAALGGSGTGGTGSGTRRRAFGGSLGAGESSLVNERGIESFAAGGQKASFPSGLGIFTPLKSGNVNPRGGGAGGNIYFNISGSNPETIWRFIEPRINTWAAAIFGVNK